MNGTHEMLAQTHFSKNRKTLGCSFRPSLAYSILINKSDRKTPLEEVGKYEDARDAMGDLWAGESVADYETRISSVDGRKRSYIAASFNKIVSGCKYRRVFDFAPQSGDQAEISEALANVNFFLRAFDTPRTKAIDLELYHNAETMKGRGDFHFRVSDRQLVLRVGGHGNGYANAAILINDTRVIEEFRRYFDSILVAPATKHVRYEDLETLRGLLQKGDVISAKRFLESGKVQPGLPPDRPQISILDKKEEQCADSHERAGTPDHIAETAVLLAAGVELEWVKRLNTTKNACCR